MKDHWEEISQMYVSGGTVDLCSHRDCLLSEWGKPGHPGPARDPAKLLVPTCPHTCPVLPLPHPQVQGLSQAEGTVPKEIVCYRALWVCSALLPFFGLCGCLSGYLFP